MENRSVLIELYDNMPTNKIEDCKSSGDFIRKPYKEAVQLIDILVASKIEFCAWEMGDCLMDMSYKYWE